MYHRRIKDWVEIVVLEATSPYPERPDYCSLNPLNKNQPTFQAGNKFYLFSGIKSRQNHRVVAIEVIHTTLKWFFYTSCFFFRRNSWETMWFGENCKCFSIGMVILYIYILSFQYGNRLIKNSKFPRKSSF